MIHSKSHHIIKDKIDLRTRGPDEVETFYDWNKI